MVEEEQEVKSAWFPTMLKWTLPVIALFVIIHFIKMTQTHVIASAIGGAIGAGLVMGVEILFAYALGNLSSNPTAARIFYLILLVGIF